MYQNYIVIVYLFNDFLSGQKVEVEHGVDILEVPLQREDDFASFLSHFDFLI